MVCNRERTVRSVAHSEWVPMWDFDDSLGWVHNTFFNQLNQPTETTVSIHGVRQGDITYFSNKVLKNASTAL
jgi:hypothetical protein